MLYFGNNGSELLYGAECSNTPKENIALISDFCDSVSIIPISDSIESYASQKAELRRKGLLIDDFDLLIGCTAITNNMIMVSDNTKHFERLPIKLENWVNR